MSITAKSQQSNMRSNNLQSATSKTKCSLPTLGAELEYLQEATGRYLSFYWLQSSLLGINSEHQLTGDWEQDEVLVPVDKAAYLQKLQQILTSLIPERYQCWFSYRQHLFELELVISPVIPSLGNAATNVFVMGRLLQGPINKQDINIASENFCHITLSSRKQHYQRIVNKITKSVRRTLDLDLILQQTVEILGLALRVERCFICRPDEKLKSLVHVVAESHNKNLCSFLGATVEITPESAFARAFSSLVPVVGVQPEHPQLNGKTILAVATCHQERPNGLIALTLCDEYLPLSNSELELAKEVADHLGTAIAHATLYKELELARSLAESARKQAEDATRRKNEFVASISHELRTPLNGMIGFLKLILDDMVDDPEELNSFIQEAHKSSLHLLDIVNDILDIAKIEAGKMDFDFQPAQLGELFREVESFMRPQAEQKKLDFRTFMPDTYDEILVYGDYQRLKQVMLNLLSNAIKFTHEGGVEVTAEVVPKKTVFGQEEFPGMVRVRVADTGIGVSLDKQDKLFQLFSQVDGSRTRQFGGTGLGLAISQKLVEAMGGEVHFYSLGEGLGSTVTFTALLYQQPVMVSSNEDIDGG